MALNGMWIDPSDDNVVTVDGSPENVVTAITDKSVSGNNVAAVNPDLLANFNGDDGVASPPGYTSQDLSARVPTFVGTAQLDTAQKKFGASSLFLDGNSDYVTFPQSTDFDFGAGDFTVECWVRFNSDPLTGNLVHVFVAKWGGTTSRSWALAFLRGSPDTLVMSYSANGSTVFNFQEPWSPTNGVWYHLAHVREGDSWRMFVDGVQLGTDTTISVTLHTHSGVLSVGANENATWGNFTDGWIDDLRIVKGTALYTADFTPPTRAHPMPPASVFDAQSQRLLEFDEVSSMSKVPIVIGDFIANFNGVDGVSSPPGYVSDDAGARVPTFRGNAQLDTAQKRFGTASALFDGTGDWIGFPDSDDWHFGAGDFTVELFVRFNDTTGQQHFIGQWPGSSNRGWLLEMLTSTTIRFVWSTTGSDVVVWSVSWTPSTDTWYHVAVVRFGGLSRLFIDGVQQGADDVQIAGDTLNNSTDMLTIGARSDNSQPFDGWIDSVRIVKGTAIYTTDFDPLATEHPTDPFQDMNGPDFEVFAVIGDNSRQESELVLDFEGTDGDTAYTSDDSSARVATFFGDAELDDAQKRFGSTSLFLDSGNGYITFPDSSDFEIGAGDFTMECWVRWATDPGLLSQTFLSKFTSAGNQAEWIWYLTSNQMTFGHTENGSTVTYEQSPFNPVVDTWYHLAVERADELLTFYVDDVDIGSHVITSNIFSGTSVFYVGAASTGLRFSAGNIDGVRFIKGVALRSGDAVLGVTGDASPLDETGWRITRPSMYTAKFSVGDEATNFVVLDTPQDNENIVISMAYDSTVGYIEARINGDVSDSIAYTGTPGFSHDFVMGEKRGDILETVYVDRLLGALDRQRVEGYLANKWSIPSVLPVGHPFKETAPDIVVDAELVANFNGADAATSYTAETGQVATFASQAQLDDAQQKFGALESPVGTSLLLDGTSDCVTFPDSADWDFGSGDFTVEFWIRFNGVPTGNMWPIGSYNSTGDQRSWGVRLNLGVSPQALQVLYSTDGTAGTTITVGDPWLPASATWYHIAVSRNGPDLRIFIDGVVNTTANVGADSLHDSTEELRIGGVDFGSGITEVVDGWIDSVRVIKGTGLYQNDFTLPHREFQTPSTRGTIMLANFNGQDGVSSPPGYLTEDSRAREAIWSGSAQLDTAQKKFGLSSLLLNGTTDFIEFPNVGSPLGDLGITTVESKTIEYWVRPGAGSIGSPTGGSKELMNKGGQVGLYWTNWRNALTSAGAVSAQVYQSGGAIINVTSTDLLTLDTWHHVAFTWDVSVSPRVLELFIDGVSQGTGSSTIAPFDAPLTQPGLVFGHQIASTTDYFPGHFDGFRMSEGILYTADFDPPTAPPSTEFIV